MILRSWAEELARGAVLPDETQRAIDLHVADIATAFFAGSRTPEAFALARLFASRGNSATHAAGALAAIIRHTEIDDIHVASCITPGAAVVPVALAFMQSAKNRAHNVERAIAAGYAVGIWLGQAIGGARAFTCGVWPSLFVAPIMAAATASVCLALDERQTCSALALAAAGTGGRVGRIATSPSGRWLVFGEAVAKGCNAAMAAQAGFHGDPDLITRDGLAAVAPGLAILPEALPGLSIDAAIRSVGFKPFVAARQTINAIHAFRTLLLQEGLDARSIDHVEVGVPTINAEMVAQVPQAGDRLGTISSMAVQIATTALRPYLLYDVERIGIPDAGLAAFMARVSVVADPELDAQLPAVWAGRVRVTAGGRRFEETCLSTPGDGLDTAESVVRDKLGHMVPASRREICLAQVKGTAERAANRRRLLEQMAGALRSG